jgi:hypothetical protein
MGLRTCTVFVDNPSYRNSDFGVRCGIAVLALVALPWTGNVTPLAGQSDYRGVAVADGAELVGTAVFSGEVLEPRRLLVTKDEGVCGFGYLERTEVKVGENRGLAGGVVVVEGIQEGKAWPESPGGYVLDQKDCVFLPQLLVVPRASDVDIVNSDPVLHHVHAYELIDGSGRTLFNLGQPRSKEVIVQQLRPRLGNLVRLEYDAHDFMQGWIYAADSPYWAVTRGDGTFIIEDVPPGEYSITAWHPSLVVRQHRVSLSAGGAAELVLEFTDE